MKTGIVIQARRSSTRLKDKILMELPAGSGISMLGRVIVRAKKACDTVILATSNHKEDDLTEQEALKYGAEVFRGSLEDVLMRYIKACEKYGIERVVRITADCPCIDYEVIKECINIHENSSVDYVSNVEKRTFPHGLDTEVITLSALKRTDMEEKDVKVREHVTWHARKNDSYTKMDVIEKNGQNYSAIRITVDAYEDYALMNLIYV
ncbi:MAG: acylneuraminate cytidylyltransferase, partial [Mucispirillum sp.]|nr:acylneuraminate cytidylyltransferase [Mucispirillum sp.]